MKHVFAGLACAVFPLAFVLFFVDVGDPPEPPVTRIIVKDRIPIPEPIKIGEPFEMIDSKNAIVHGEKMTLGPDQVFVQDLDMLLIITREAKQEEEKRE